MSNPVHVMARVIGYLSRPVTPLHKHRLSVWGAVEERLSAYLIRPRYDSLSYIQSAYERLQSCPSDHTPRRRVIITLPPPCGRSRSHR